MVRILGAVSLAASVLVATNLGLASGSWAQSNPSVDQLIDQLKPKVQALHDPTRGLRKLGNTVEPTIETPADGTVPPKPQMHASAPPPASAASPTPVDQAPSATLYVNFANGSAKLTAEAMATLDKLGQALNSDALAGSRFRIEGHTDTVGSRQYNISLSAQRAAAVAEYIEQKFGVTEKRLIPVGVGSDHLLVPTVDQTPEARNRRVVVINLST